MKFYQHCRFGVSCTLLTLLILLQGCGFHLRGSLDQPLHIPAAMKVTYIQSTQKHGELTKGLRKNLALYGVTVTKDRQQATGVLEIVDERFRRRTLSVDGQAKEQEFELFLEVTFKLISHDGLDIVEAQTLSVNRSYLFDKNDPLGKNNEEAVIRKDMARNLVSRILRIIQAKTAASETA